MSDFEKEQMSNIITALLAAIAAAVGAVILVLEQSSRTWKAVRENRVVNTVRIGFELFLATPVLAVLLAGAALERKLKSPPQKA